jgi:hypothetical protein
MSGKTCFAIGMSGDIRLRSLRAVAKIRQAQVRTGISLPTPNTGMSAWPKRFVFSFSVPKARR